MSKPGFKNLNEVYKSILKKLGKAELEKSDLDEIGNFILTQIIGYARSGKNPKSMERFKPLSSKWIKRREELAKTNQTSDVFSKGRSNLNVTGQLLDKNNYLVTSNTESKSITIEPTGSHKPYVDKKGKAIGETITNKELAGYVADQGREYLVIGYKIANLGKKMIQQIYRKKLNDVLRKK